MLSKKSWLPFYTKSLMVDSTRIDEKIYKASKVKDLMVKAANMKS